MPADARTCAHCGLPILRNPKASAKFCSTACSVAFNTALRKDWQETNTHADRVLALFAQGYGRRRIALDVGISDQRVKHLLRRLNPPAQIKKLRGEYRYEPNPLIHLRRAFEEDARSFLKGDELTHWNNHPESVRWSNNRVAKNQWHKHKHNPTYRLSKTMKTAVWAALQVGHNKKIHRSFRLIGCSVVELKEHLERQFDFWMSWKNYGTAWEVDHIRPLISFDLAIESQQKKAFHFSNLRPLDKKSNRAKSARRFPVLEKRILDNF